LPFPIFDSQNKEIKDNQNRSLAKKNLYSVVARGYGFPSREREMKKKSRSNAKIAKVRDGRR
jgi:hypothetical protein